jgi:acyl-CoA reductase-like NAD-dependent aldehyde dehydrogenase|tara:strand:- start:4501 stop:5937 length:1437 start_codon:yes stop_codon:yes gene_type:complete
MWPNAKNLTLVEINKPIIKEVFSPWDRSQIGSVECIKKNDVKNIVAAAQDAFKNSKDNFTKQHRIEFFDKAVKKLGNQVNYFASLIAKEGGKPIKDARVEVIRAVNGLELCRDEIKSRRGSEIPMELNSASMNKMAIEREFPAGVVLALSAFNHPLNLIVHQVGPAIAAGCPIIIKPSLETPYSCYEFIKLLFESGLPVEFCQMINNADHEVTAEFVKNKNISFFSFIGSSDVGWKLKSQLPPGAKCALEHGGVAPVIIDNGVNLKKIIKPIVKGSFYHAGQVCVSIQNIIVHKKIISEFIDLMKEEVFILKVGNPSDVKTDVGPLIRPSEVDRVDTLVQEALKLGATLVCGGKRLSDTTYACTVLKNPPLDSKVVQKEIFGPVVNIFEFDDIDEAIGIANHNEFAFQSSVFTNNLNKAMYCYEKLIAKTVLINEQTTFRVDWMPFGGIRHSGEGVGGISYSYSDMVYNKVLIIDTLI